MRCSLAIALLSASTAVEAARRVGVPTPILPKLRHDEHGRVVGIVFPDDPDYDRLP